MTSSGYTDSELAAMMSGLESDLVERTESWSSSTADKVRKNICAFANDLPGNNAPGVFFVGAHDDGSCAGIDITDELLKDLANLRDDGLLLPRPSVDVQERVLDGCHVAVVAVQPALDPPVRYKGRAWVRVGPTVRQATPADERRLAERRRALDAPFDLRPASGSKLSDLDLNHIERQYLPQALAADVLEQNQRTLEEQMHSLRLLREGVPTWGSLLAFGRDPQQWLPGAYVQFVRHDGIEITDPIKSHHMLSGQLEDVLRSLNQLLEINIETSVDVISGPREQRYPDYPIEALRQLSYNAIMHRNYEGTNAPSRLRWFSDRVEIESPGGLFGTITPESLKQGATDYRNQLVAELMANLGFAQRFGLGIPLAQRSLRENGNPDISFMVEQSRIQVTVGSAKRSGVKR